MKSDQRPGNLDYKVLTWTGLPQEPHNPLNWVSFHCLSNDFIDFLMFEKENIIII